MSFISSLTWRGRLNCSWHKQHNIDDQIFHSACQELQSSGSPRECNIPLTLTQDLLCCQSNHQSHKPYQRAPRRNASFWSTAWAKCTAIYRVLCCTLHKSGVHCARHSHQRRRCCHLMTLRQQIVFLHSWVERKSKHLKIEDMTGENDRSVNSNTYEFMVKICRQICISIYSDVYALTQITRSTR